MRHAGYLPMFDVPALARRTDPATSHTTASMAGGVLGD